MASLYKKRGYYFVDFWVGNKRKSLNTQLKAITRNTKAAENMKAEIEREVEITKKEVKEQKYETLLNTNDIDVKAQLTILELIEKYKIRLSMWSHSHQELFSYAMKYLLDIIPSDIMPSEVTSEHIVLYIKTLQRKVSNASLMTYLNYIKSFFNYIVDEGYIIKSPVRKKDIPRKNRTNIVTFDTALSDKLLTEAFSRDFIFYCILKLLGFTGVRPVDLLKLRVKDLDFDNKRIRVRISKTSKEILFPMYDELETFLSNEMKDIVNQTPDVLLFDGYSVDRVGRKFRRMKLRLGILEKYKFNLKTFRKTFATHYAKKLNIQDVAYLLGHDKTETTRTFYADVVVDDIRNKMEKK